MHSAEGYSTATTMALTPIKQKELSSKNDFSILNSKK